MTDAFWGTAIAVKRHKRMHIAILETDRIIYTPPNFMKIPNRATLAQLADAMTKLQRRDIGLIMEFESRWGSRRG